MFRDALVFLCSVLFYIVLFIFSDAFLFFFSDDLFHEYCSLLIANITCLAVKRSFFTLAVSLAIYSKLNACV